MGQMLIRLGLMIAVVGLVFQYGSRFGLGHLPGDITIKGDGYEMHLPIATCVLISLAVSGVLWLVRRLGGS